jgi:hypothetical protein
MRNPLYRKILTGLLLIGFSLACGIPFLQPAPPATETPTSTLTLTAGPTPTETPLPTAVGIITLAPAATASGPFATPGPKFAPFCQPSSASVATPIQCREPIAEQSSAFCSDKVPYNLIRINLGSTYEISTESISCSEVGLKDGKLLLLCTGPMVLSFEMKVCDPACDYPTFSTGTTRCPEDLNYNETYGCCEREPIPVDQNCVELKLDTIRCVVGCSEYTDQATCDKNGRACRWDREREVCYPR